MSESRRKRGRYRGFELNGRGWIRTNEGISHQIYSLTRLSTSVHARQAGFERGSIDSPPLFSRIRERAPFATVAASLRRANVELEVVGAGARAVEGQRLLGERRQRLGEPGRLLDHLAVAVEERRAVLDRQLPLGRAADRDGDEHQARLVLHDLRPARD